VKRLWLSLVLGTFILTAQKPEPVYQEPPEEDVSPSETREYVFNPLQAEKEMKVGRFYLKKGSYRAAVRRFQEALKWNPNSGEAYLRLAEAHLKMDDDKAAREAWKKYLEVDPDGKEASDIRKKLARN
jgi:outer membrane protein assembly factor BamD (BamD/ComL family)